jgi:cytochrome c
MKIRFLFCLLILIMAGCTVSSERSETKILLFTDSVELNTGRDYLRTGKYEGRTVTAGDVSYIQEDSLRMFSGIVIRFSDINKLNTRAVVVLKRYLEAGGGGIVAIRDTLLSRDEWPWLKAWNRFPSGQDLKQDAGNVRILEQGFSPTDLEGSLKYVIGKNVLPVYSTATTLPVPDASRYAYQILSQGLDEPMQMAILPNHDVLIVERKGAVKLFETGTGKTKTIYNFNVFSGIEDGLLGVAIHPAFERNHHVYFYYAVAGEQSVNRLCRMDLIGSELIASSEKVLLEVPTQRKYCCHSAGYLQFGPDTLLYLSTGDNTNAEETEGYIPIDERPGRHLADDQATAANSNDLRGKILRIKPEPDGTYSIPQGNLFPEGMARTRPEIYVMGNRNPYRFSVDMKNGFVYWGDVGPDTNVKSGEGGGTLSYDEINQARKPGFFGWPYFLGNNEAFPEYDYATKLEGPKFDPVKPINNSVNNTGIKVLPPAQPAMIWYENEFSKEFPLVGKGGQSAMAGPVYYPDLFPDAPFKLPAYYAGKLIIYDWVRRWIMAVTFDENMNYLRMEPFLDHLEFTAPTDIQFAPDGSLYILEYGTNWFAKNTDAKLIRVTYTEGNRKPVARITANNLYGTAPFQADLSASGSEDFDNGDRMQYKWVIEGKELVGENITYAFDNPGVYSVLLSVEDNHGNTGTSAVNIKVGNAPPVVQISVAGNRSFYWDDARLDYTVNISDTEDDPIDADRVNVKFTYLPLGKDVAVAVSQSGSVGVENEMARNASSLHPRGATLLQSLDCKACHSLTLASAGPSYVEVARKYSGKDDAKDWLSQKIINGGAGVWGTRAMTAHPDLSVNDAKEIVDYILELDNDNVSLPRKGSLVLKQHVGKGNEGSYLLVATYTDKGANGIEPLSTQSYIALRNPLIEVEEYDGGNITLQTVTTELLTYAHVVHGNFLKFDDLDLTDINSIKYRLHKQGMGGRITVRLDQMDGPIVSTFDLPAGASPDIKKDWIEVTAPLIRTPGQHTLFFHFTNEKALKKSLFNLDWIYFSRKGRSF